MKVLPFLAVLGFSSLSHALEVSLLTPSGPKVLKNWSPAGLRELTKKGSVSAQELVFDRSTGGLDLNARADIDLVTLHGRKGKVARIPRFMIWRGNLRFKISSGGELQSSANASPSVVPLEFFSVDGVERIELGRASSLYPGTKLQVRTNPAATRGEKLFTQSCMACHSLDRAPKLEATLLNEGYLRDFGRKHGPTRGVSLDARTLRGLLAYREALASEKSSVNSTK